MLPSLFQLLTSIVGTLIFLVIHAEAMSPTLQPTIANPTDTLLFAVLNGEGCAEAVPYGPLSLTSAGSSAGDEVYFTTDTSVNINHKEWLQIVTTDGTTEMFRITWTFNDIKSVTDRMITAVASGEPANFLVEDTENGGTQYSLSGTWYFSTSAGLNSGNFFSGATGSQLSSDDGAWGGANNPIDGEFVEFAARPPGFWGIGNFNGPENSTSSGCPIIYTNGNYRNGFTNHKTYMYVKLFAPTGQPTTQPSSEPTQPSSQPSSQPSTSPSSHPTIQPTSQPTCQPTTSPTSKPTCQPTSVPSTTQPSGQPSTQPSASPSRNPTSQPTSQPTSIPTSSQPSSRPSTSPSSHPTMQPTSQPTCQPTTSPTSKPTCQPTSVPSTTQPSGQPSTQPSTSPSIEPTSQPSSNPTPKPSPLPSTAPSAVPTTFTPSAAPSAVPTTFTPSAVPSAVPTTFTPSAAPSAVPTTITPSAAPSAVPTFFTPSAAPSAVPTTFTPSAAPSAVPTTFTPSAAPSAVPTSFTPSAAPSAGPTTITPSAAPSAVPTTLTPSAAPRAVPTTFTPSAAPSALPASAYPSTIFPSSSLPTTSVPSAEPSALPTTYFPSTASPSFLPSLSPSWLPTSIPSSTPSSQPTSEPTIEIISAEVGFNLSVELFGLGSANFSAQDKEAFLRSLANSAGVPRRDCRFVSFRLLERRRMSLKFGIAAFSTLADINAEVAAEISTELSNYPNVTNTSSLFNLLTDNLDQSVSSGRFVNLLRNISSELNATGTSIISAATAEVTSSSIIQAPTFQPTSFPTSTPTISLATYWEEEYTSFITDIIESTSDIILEQLLYSELDVEGNDPYQLQGSCSDWTSFITGSVDTANVIYAPNEIAIHVVHATSIDAQEFISTSKTCNDSVMVANILTELTANFVDLSSKVIQCDGNDWIVRYCSATDVTPSVCVGCTDPCSGENHCLAASDVGNAFFNESYPFSISPCAARQCPTSFIDSSAVRLLEVNYEALDTAPVINSLLSGTVTRSRIVIRAEIEESGFLHCGAVEEGEVPTSVGDIIGQDFGNIINTASGVTTVEITGLEPVTDYSLYCVTESTSGTLMTLSEMQSNVLSVQTACCKTVSVSLSATSFIEGVSVSNAISYALSHAPSASLGLKINTLLNTTLGDGFMPIESVFTPEERVISSTAGSLTRSSALQALQPGFYRINITLSESSQDEYEIVYKNSDEAAVFQSFLVFAETVPPPAPIFLRATFAPDGAFIALDFDAATNRGGLSTQFPCDELFDFVCADQSFCRWTSDSTIRAFVVATNCDVRAPIPGDTVQLLGSPAVTAKCEDGTVTCSSYESAVVRSVIISSSDDSISPTVTISVPSSVGACDDLLLDVTGSIGSGGRDWLNVTVTVVSSETNDVSDLQNYLSSNLTLFPASTIPSMLLNRGFSYTFYATLCNFLGVCNVGSATVIVIDSSIPLVQIPGQSIRTIKRSDQLKIGCFATINDCAGVIRLTGLSIKWGVLEDNIQLNELGTFSNDPRTFLLPPFSLIAGGEYVITVSATSQSTSRSATTSTTVFVEIGDIVVRTEQGTQRNARKNETTIIDASSSYDEDVETLTGTAAGLLYTWSCEQTAPTYALDCSSLFESATTNAETFTLIPLDSAISDSIGLVTVEVSDGSGSRRADLQIAVTVLPAVAPAITVVSNVVSKINPEQTLRLTGTIILPSTSTGNATWTVDDDSFDLDANALTPLVTTILPSTSGSTAAQAFVYLVVAPGNLISGTEMTFTLTCATLFTSLEGISSESSASTSITIEVNDAPVPGSFTILPDEGLSFSTQFRFTALQWQDDDLPLSYEFGYLTLLSVQIRMIARSELTSDSTQLPTGSLNDDYSLATFCLVYDSLNANTTQTSSVTVLPGSSLTTLEIQTFVNASVTSTVQSTPSAIRQSAALSLYLLNEVNCSLAPNCSALNRFDCSETAHTCGSCISDAYTGVDGDSNQLCALTTEVTSSLSTPCVSITDCGIFETCVENICVEASKECAGDCNGNGDCIFINTDTGLEIDSCTFTDPTCSAICDCAADYSESSDCSVTNEDIEIRRGSRFQVLCAIEDLINSEDADEDTIVGWINFLSIAAQEADELSQQGYSKVLNITTQILVLSSTVELNYDVTELLLNAINGATKATLSSGERRRRRHRRRRLLQSSVSSSNAGFEVERSMNFHRFLQSEDAVIEDRGLGLNITEEVQQSIDALQSFGAYVASTLLPGQQSITAVLSEFRISVEVISPFITATESSSEDFASLDAIITMPQTGLEGLNGEVPFSIRLSISQENSSSDGVEAVSMALRSELLTDTGNFQSKPFNLFLSEEPCLEETCSAEITLQFSDEVDTSLQQELEGEVVETDCKKNEKEIVQYTCSDGFILNIECDGEEGTVTSQCPTTKVTSVCNSIENLQVTDSNCTVLEFTSSYVTCSCQLDGAASSNSDTRFRKRHKSRKRRYRRRFLQSDDDAADDDGEEEGTDTYAVNYVAMAQSTSTTFTDNFASAKDIDGDTLRRNWVVLATTLVFLWVVVMSLVIGVHYDEKMRKFKESGKKGQKHRQKGGGAKIEVKSGRSFVQRICWPCITLAKLCQTRSRPLIERLSSQSFRMSSSSNSSTYSRKSIFSKKRANISSQVYMIEESLPHILHSKSLADRLMAEVKHHHRWLSVIFHFSETFPRAHRIMALTTTALTMLFFQTLTYDLVNPDDGTCEEYDNRDDCLEEESPFRTGESKCGWDGNSCKFVQPNTSTRIILFVAIFSALLSTPIAVISHWILKKILSAPERTADMEEESRRSHSSRRLSVKVMSALGITADTLKQPKKAQLDKAAMVELMALSVAIRKYRHKLSTEEKEEFDSIWGLDQEGYFLSSNSNSRFKADEGEDDDEEEDENNNGIYTCLEMMRNFARCRFKKYHVNLNLLHDLENLRSRELAEVEKLKEEKASNEEIGRRLLFLFQADLLQGVQCSILEAKGNRDFSKPRLVSKTTKIIGWTVLGLFNLGMLAYIFLFAINQESKARQWAWFQSFILWLVLEVLFVSTAIVIMTHIVMPSFIMKDVNKIKERLVQDISKFQANMKEQSKNRLENDLHADSFGVGDDEENAKAIGEFNAASYLFISHRVAKHYPDILESQIILEYLTPWPRQSYQHQHDTAKSYDKTFASLMKSFSIIFFYFLAYYINVPASFQDVVTEAISTTAMGYITFLHLQLFSIHPVLIGIPVICIAIVLHFYIVSNNAEARMKLARLVDASKIHSTQQQAPTEQQGTLGEEERDDNTVNSRKYSIDVVEQNEDRNQMRLTPPTDVIASEFMEEHDISESAYQQDRAEIDALIPIHEHIAHSASSKGFVGRRSIARTSLLVADLDRAIQALDDDILHSARDHVEEQNDGKLTDGSVNKIHQEDDTAPPGCRVKSMDSFRAMETCSSASSDMELADFTLKKRPMPDMRRDMDPNVRHISVRPTDDDTNDDELDEIVQSGSAYVPPPEKIEQAIVRAKRNAAVAAATTRRTDAASVMSPRRRQNRDRTSGNDSDLSSDVDELDGTRLVNEVSDGNYSDTTSGSAGTPKKKVKSAFAPSPLPPFNEQSVRRFSIKKSDEDLLETAAREAAATAALNMAEDQADLPSPSVIASRHGGAEFTHGNLSINRNVQNSRARVNNFMSSGMHGAGETDGRTVHDPSNTSDNNDVDGVALFNRRSSMQLDDISDDGSDNEQMDASRTNNSRYQPT